MSGSSSPLLSLSPCFLSLQGWAMHSGTYCIHPPLHTCCSSAWFPAPHTNSSYKPVWYFLPWLICFVFPSSSPAICLPLLHQICIVGSVSVLFSFLNSWQENCVLLWTSTGELGEGRGEECPTRCFSCFWSNMQCWTATLVGPNLAFRT